jgi:site-specific DNA recombinase
LKRRELDKIRHKLDGLIEAIAEGFRAPGLQARLDKLELHRVRLEAEIDGAPATAPRQHGTILRWRRSPWG